MAGIPFLHNIDLNENQLLNAKLHTSGTAPSSPGTGTIWYDSTNDKVKVYDTDTWYTVGNTTEEIQDIVGAMFSSNTETGVTVTYQDSDGTIDLVVGSATSITVADESSDATCFPLFATAATGDLAPKTGSNLTFNSSSGLLTATSFAGALTGDVTGNADTVTSIGNLTGDVTSINRTTTIAAGAIDLAHMSANSVDSDQYVDGSIDLIHMSANSVDSDQYVDGSIDLIHMSANSVDSDQYVDGSVDNVHLANDGITIGTADTSLGGTVTALVGLTDLDLTAGNKTIFDTVGANTLTMGAADTTITIPGNLKVTGDTTYSNETIQVVTDNTISFEGSTADAHEIHLTGADATADRTITLPDATGTVALTGNIGNGTITITAGNALTTGGTFTTNQSGNTEITLHHEDTSSQASVDNSGRTYIQDITLDTYGHVTSLTSATETVTNTNTQLATAAALVDVSAMAGNSTASFTHSLASKNLIVQLYDTTSGQIVHADVDHTSTSAISITFAQTGTQMVAASIGDIRVVVIDAVHGVTDKTVTYS